MPMLVATTKNGWMQKVLVEEDSLVLACNVPFQTTSTLQLPYKSQLFVAHHVIAPVERSRTSNCCSSTGLRSTQRTMRSSVLLILYRWDQRVVAENLVNQTMIVLVLRLIAETIQKQHLSGGTEVAKTTRMPPAGGAERCSIVQTGDSSGVVVIADSAQRTTGMSERCYPQEEST